MPRTTASPAGAKQADGLDTRASAFCERHYARYAVEDGCLDCRAIADELAATIPAPEAELGPDWTVCKNCRCGLDPSMAFHGLDGEKNVCASCYQAEWGI